MKSCRLQQQTELEATVLREISQAQKEKYSSHSLVETKMLIWKNEVKWWSLETGKGVEKGNRRKLDKGVSKHRQEKFTEKFL